MILGPNPLLFLPQLLDFLDRATNPARNVRECPTRKNEKKIPLLAAQNHTAVFFHKGKHERSDFQIQTAKRHSVLLLKYHTQNAIRTNKLCMMRVFAIMI